jgi:predicted Zn-dependent peptidase
MAALADNAERAIMQSHTFSSKRRRNFYGRDDARGFRRRNWPRIMVEQELIDMTNNNVTAAELQQAKALLLRQIPLSEASEDAVAAGYVGRARVGLPLDKSANAAKCYFDMTADEVRAAFARHINPANFVQVVRGPTPQLRKNDV